MAKKKAKLGLFGIIMLAVAAVGVVLAVVGLCIDWFTSTVEVLGKSTSEGVALFEDGLDKLADFPVAAVQAFAIIGLIFAVVSCAAFVLNAFGVVQVKGIVKLIVAVLTIVMAILAIVFAFVFAGQVGGVDAGDFGGVSFTVGAGAYLLAIGSVMSGVALLLQRN